MDLKQTNWLLCWLIIGVIFVFGLMMMKAAHAAPPTKMQSEINYLLGFVEDSGCEFNRNGIWYDSKKAHDHLLKKYIFLESVNYIHTAEEFIEEVAMESSFSHQSYEVKCQGGPAMSSSQWLHDSLAEFRNK